MALTEGYAAPVARVFNESGLEVFERVTSFRYSHSEKVEDSSRIVIETNDIFIVDHPDLQEGKVLKVVFGYLGGKIFRAHKVWIWDLSVTFNDQGVRLEIIAFCKAAYMKLNSSKDVHDGTSLESLAESLAEVYGLNLKKDGLEGEQKEGLDEIQSGLPRRDILDAQGPDLRIRHAIDNTSYVKRYVFKNYESVPQANKSDGKLLEELAAIEPNDNILIDNRDDELIIKKRNLLQKPYKSYKYKSEPNYLLEFIPAIKNTHKRKESVSNSISGWDEELGEFFQGMVSSSHSSNGVLGDEVELTLEEQLIRKVSKDIDNPFDQGKSIDGLFHEEYAGEDEDGKPFFKKVFTNKLDSTNQFFLHITKAGTRPSQFDANRSQMSAALDATGRITTRSIIPLNPKEYLPLVENTVKDAAGAGVNRQSKKALEINECTAIVVGDPELQSGRIITILGVGKKYSGNYYIVSAEHDISQQGYFVRLVLFKNGSNKVVEDSSKVGTNDLGLISNKQVALPFDGTSELLQVPIIKD